MTEISFRSAGTRLFAVESGKGRPVIFIHGGLADHRAALYRLGPLAETHRVIAPDARSAGRSHFDGALSWDMLADDIAALLDHLGLATAVIGGVSAGSGIAVRFALRHPGRVEALVVQWPVFPGADRPVAEPARIAMARMDEAGRRARTEGIEAIVPLFQALPEPIRERVVAMARGFDPASVASTTAFLASGAQPFDRVEDLAALAMPVLVIPGVDPEHPSEVAALYATVLSRVTVGDPTADLPAAIQQFAPAPSC